MHTPKLKLFTDASVLRQTSMPLLARLFARFDEHHTKLEHILARKLARWAKDNFEALAACDPPLPPSAFNRLADNWRPLFAIAQVAGGHWPQRALDAFAHLSPKPDPAPEALGFNLLADIRLIFARSGATRLFSSSLVESLHALPDRPWSGASPSPAAPAINQTWLARQLSPFGVRSHNLRTGGLRAKGYLLTDFAGLPSQFLKGQPPTS